MAFHTHILRCRDGTHYVGHTDDLERRIAEHRSGTLPGYTSRRLPVVFLWAQDFQTRDEAFAAERKLKGWSRAKKEAMMAGNWALVSQLARSAWPPGASTSSA